MLVQGGSVDVVVVGAAGEADVAGDGRREAGGRGEEGMGAGAGEDDGVAGCVEGAGEGEDGWGRGGGGSCEEDGVSVGVGLVSGAESLAEADEEEDGEG